MIIKLISCFFVYFIKDGDEKSPANAGLSIYKKTSGSLSILSNSF